MPDAVTPDEYFDAIVATIGMVDGVGTCQCDGLVDRETNTGTIVLVDPQSESTLEELGDESWHTSLTVELIVMVPKDSRGARRAAWMLAHDVAAATRWESWGLPVGPAVVTSVSRDDFDPFGHGDQVVRVEFTQELVWRAPAEVDLAVERVLLGEDPDIGIGNVDKYDQVYPELEE